MVMVLLTPEPSLQPPLQHPLRMIVVSHHDQSYHSRWRFDYAWFDVLVDFRLWTLQIHH